MSKVSLESELGIRKSTVRTPEGVIKKARQYFLEGKIQAIAVKPQDPREDLIHTFLKPPLIEPEERLVEDRLSPVANQIIRKIILSELGEAPQGSRANYQLYFLKYEDTGSPPFYKPKETITSLVVVTKLRELQKSV